MIAIHPGVVRVFALLALTLVSAARQDAPKTTPPQSTGAPAAPAAPAAPGATRTTGETEAPSKTASAFSTEQLEQIAAPIALYPDTLLAQVMMGATYPLEIVQASRWMQKNAALKGKALEDGLKANDWDASVKSLCGFPDVLARMNENLDWTQDLGDAFLGQKKELFAAIQSMRGKALEAGQLKTTEQQKVTQEADKTIVVESANPEVVYVPTYSPTVVYGPGWYYPTYYYPPMYVAPPPGTGLLIFSVGVAWGAGCWGNCNWNSCDVDIDIDHHNTFVDRTDREGSRDHVDNRAGNKAKWNHDPDHRKGVNYKNPQVAQKYGGEAGASRVSRDQARGFDRGTGGAGTPGVATRDAGTRAPQAGTRPAGGATRPSSTPAGGATRPSTTPSAGSSMDRGGALSGSRSPGLDSAGSTRGAASRGSSRPARAPRTRR